MLLQQKIAELKNRINYNTDVLIKKIGDIKSYVIPERCSNTKIENPSFHNDIYTFKLNINTLLDTYKITYNIIDSGMPYKIIDIDMSYKPIYEYMNYIQIRLHIQVPSKENCMSNIEKLYTKYNTMCSDLLNNLKVLLNMNNHIPDIFNSNYARPKLINKYNAMISKTFNNTSGLLYFEHNPNSPYEYIDKWLKKKIDELAKQLTYNIDYVITDIEAYVIPECCTTTEIKIPKFHNDVSLVKANIDALFNILNPYNVITDIKQFNELYIPVQDYMDYIEIRIHIANAIKDNVNTPANLNIYEVTIQPTLIKYNKDCELFKNNNIGLLSDKKKGVLTCEKSKLYLQIMNPLTQAQIEYLKIYEDPLFADIKKNYKNLSIEEYNALYLKHAGI